MWGKHVEHEIHMALKDAKEKDVERKVAMVMNRLMTDPLDQTEGSEQPVTGRFRDPAAMFKKE